jgi:hypothetical protein
MSPGANLWAWLVTARDVVELTDEERDELEAIAGRLTARFGLCSARGSCCTRRNG